MEGIKDVIYPDSEEEKVEISGLVIGTFNEAEINDASDAIFLFAISVIIIGGEAREYEKFLKDNGLTNKSLKMLSD